MEAVVENLQLGEVLSGGSYLSQHDLRIHFGLGNHATNQTSLLRPNRLNLLYLRLDRAKREC